MVIMRKLKGILVIWQKKSQSQSQKVNQLTKISEKFTDAQKIDIDIPVAMT